MARLTENLNSADLQRVRLPLEQAATLPPDAYTNPEIFDLEDSRIFQRDWICVARVEQVAEPGDFLCVDLPSEPLVISRDREGMIHGLSRVCRHRSMPVAEGAGNTGRFVCPYHNWTYELDGALRSAPMMDGVEDFDVASCSLAKVKTEVWHGFIFVNLDNNADSLSSHVSELEPLVANYRFEELVIADSLSFDSPWNWKLLVENFMEAYHHIGTHRNTLQPIYPALDASVPDNSGQPWSWLNMPAREREPLTASSFPHLTEEESGRLIAAMIFPHFLFAASASLGLWYELRPRDCEYMDLRIHILLHPAALESIGEIELSVIRDQVTAVHLEDIEANLGCWSGLNAASALQGRLSLHEKAIWQINQLWLSRMMG